MTLVVLVGGARSGKSALAVELARSSTRPVALIATAEARDEEMRVRIELHRAARPADWTILEEPVDLRGALARVDPEVTVVLDCLSLWVANLLERGNEERAILGEAAAAAGTASARSGLTVAVSNEVGLGIVPSSELGRRYRDVLGRVNAAWAASADRAALVVAGRLLELGPPDSLAP